MRRVNDEMGISKTKKERIMSKYIATFIVGVFMLMAKDVNAVESKGWTFEITPYAWFQGIDGTLTVGDKDYDFDQDFSDLYDSVDMGASLMTIARHNQWVVFGQFDYVSLDTDTNGDKSEAVRLEVDQFFGALAGGYTFELCSRATMDVLVGVRYAELDNTITGKLGGGRKADFTADSTDGIIMLRPRTKITEKLFFNPTISVGAGDADLVYELQPEFQYFFNETVDLRFGYRRIHYEFENGDNELDVDFSGFLVGVGFNF